MLAFGHSYNIANQNSYSEKQLRKDTIPIITTIMNPSQLVKSAKNVLSSQTISAKVQFMQKKIVQLHVMAKSNNYTTIQSMPHLDHYKYYIHHLLGQEHKAQIQRDAKIPSVTIQWIDFSLFFLRRVILPGKLRLLARNL
uniref:Uncharacterized protein n=1 Tax=Rhizophora mucronata TaxID=61149 RepID=A0A2P2NIB0_RHIMU